MRRTSFLPLSILIATAIGVGQGCGQQNLTSEDTSPTDQAMTKTLLTSGSTSFPNGESFPYQLLKFESADGFTTYAQWSPPTGSSGPAPVVVIANPYDGIDWSGDPVDLQWSQRPNATSGYSYPDVNGPNYVTGISQNIQYTLVPPTSELSVWYPFLHSGVGVLMIYNRFYAGKTTEDYLRNMRDGYAFLARQDGVDKARIGVMGISLGGFDAVTSAAASQDIVPAYGVAWAPPTDLGRQLAYIKVDGPNLLNGSPLLSQFRNWFEPYLRRISQANTHTLSSALARLKTHFLIIHDDWDLLAPVAVNRDLVGQAGGLVEGFWYRHTTGINTSSFQLDHAQSSEGLGANTFLFTYAYLLTRLLTAPTAQITVMSSFTTMNNTWSYLHRTALAGVDISTLTPRLIDLCDSRIVVANTDNLSTVSGPEYVASVLQNYWGLSPSVVNANNVKSYLQNHGL